MVPQSGAHRTGQRDVVTDGHLIAEDIRACRNVRSRERPSSDEKEKKDLCELEAVAK